VTRKSLRALFLCLLLDSCFNVGIMGSQSLILANARIVLKDRVAEAGSVSVRDGLIASINTTGSDTGSETQTTRRLELSGLTLFPAFIDAHIHGAVGIDVMTATAEGLGHASQFLASQGVTSWLPTLVPASDEEYQSTVAAIKHASQTTQGGARIVGLHYEGPFVNLAQCGALHKEHFKTYTGPRDLDRLTTPPNLTAKMITLAPEIDGGIELIKELQGKGWIVSIGHTRADEQVLDQAFTAGARHMTHFMNAMPQMHHRQPGPVSWGLSRDDVTCDVIADGIHLHPLTLRVLLRAKGSGSLSLISDAIAAAGKGDGDYKIWGETISIKDGRTSNASGTIAGSVITMRDAVRMMFSLGVSDVEVAQMASTNPARLLRMDQEIGSIEEGKRADLVVLDQDGEVQLTVVGGEVVFQR
jgi:N-acetylglucosamine-6-phosphate deacetylase